MLKRPLHYPLLRMLLSSLVWLSAVSPAFAQSTTFTYQGKLADSGNPADGQYDFQFKLFDTSTVGTGIQFGSIVTVSNVTVAAGIFTVQLDFGVSVFPGAARYLEIAVKQTSGATFTTLGPRQPVTSHPYAIRSLAATAADGLSVACVGCITSSQIQTVQGSQLTGLIPVASVPPGSDNYVQNTNTPQASVSFSIGGTGTANILNATTQFNLGGNRILGNAGTNNVFAGIGAGAVNAGSENAFFGRNAGFSNTTGGNNSFFGNTAGGRNTAGGSNSFFGSFAGSFNMGSFNSFFGEGAGNFNDTGSGNSFFGTSAGFNNTTGQLNAFFGEGTGSANTIGTGNTFIGRAADFVAPGATGDNNTLLGLSTKVVSGVSNGTAIGSQAQVAQSNSLVLGSINGMNGATSDTNVGIGTTAPLNRLVVDVGASTASDPGVTIQGKTSAFGDIGLRIRNTAPGGVEWYIDSTDNNSNYGGSKLAFTPRGNITPTLTLNSTGNVGIGTTAPRGWLEVVGDWDGSFGAETLTGDRPTIRFSGGPPAANQQWILHLGSAVGLTPAGSLSFFNGGTTGTFSLPAMALTPGGTVAITNLGSAGANALCRNASNEISSCSSSLRYKTSVQPFAAGLEIINRLRPISFTWKQGGKKDIGLGAEEVEKVEPLLTFRNDKGEIEGVNYSQLSAVFINAFKQQRSQITNQHQQIKKQQREIDAFKKRLQEFDLLKGLVCADHPAAAVCKSNKKRP